MSYKIYFKFGLLGTNIAINIDKNRRNEIIFYHLKEK
jgi:hypothetical protein